MVCEDEGIPCKILPSAQFSQLHRSDRLFCFKTQEFRNDGLQHWGFRFISLTQYFESFSESISNFFCRLQCYASRLQQEIFFVMNDVLNDSIYCIFRFELCSRTRCLVCSVHSQTKYLVHLVSFLNKMPHLCMKVYEYMFKALNYTLQL